MNQIARLLHSAGAVRRGDFTLSSGRQSDLRVDVEAASLTPRGVWLISSALAVELSKLKPDAVGGPELGAVPIIGALLERLYGLANDDVRGFIIRKATKDHGQGGILEGVLKPGSRCVVIDDVCTSGESVLRAVNILRSHGHSVARAVVVVDRGEGASELLAKNGVALTALVTRTELLS